jgi:Dolichyl-phosphate-mannose-protein mannosyltransferase
MHLPSSPVRLATLAGIVIVAAALLFARLGHYAFWDDEAVVALDAKGVLRTGNASVLLDHGNVIGYRRGTAISNFVDQVDPPLETYLVAGSFALFDLGTWQGRLPFALCGLGVFGLAALWVRDENGTVLSVFAIALLTNVSLILFCRQCHYYGLSIFLSMAIAYVYWRWKPTPRNLLIVAALSVLLFAGNYLNYLALYACLAVDYFAWSRRERPLTQRDMLLLLGPQVVANGLIGYIWNPFRTPYAMGELANSFADRLALFFWFWRDMGIAELISLPIMLVALYLGVQRGHTTLLRGCVAMALYVLVITVLSPQPVEQRVYADIRYVAPLIPLALALETGAICALLGRKPLLAIAAALLVFGTNLFNGGPWLEWGVRSTFLSYLGELAHPPPEPYTPAAQWINAHVPDGESVWVAPDIATYPLMFHAPRALYAWQFDWPPRPDLASLPPIHFIGQQPPDYIVAFGPWLGAVRQVLTNWNHPDVTYAQVATLDTFYRDKYRPELFWRTFTPITNYDPQTQAIYILRRVTPPIVAPKPE